MTREEQDNLKKIIDERIKFLMPTYLETNAFTQRKLTDTPNDDLMVTPRRYVNMNGLVTARPKSSIATMGQKYFATDTNILMILNTTTNKWYNGSGSVVATGL